MSFYDDQEDDWFANDCKGDPSDYYAGDIGPWVETSKREPMLGPEERKILLALNRAAKGKGFKVEYHGNGHFQLRAGRRVINWYPLSKKQTCYDQETAEKRFRLTVAEVVEWVLRPEGNRA